MEKIHQDVYAATKSSNQMYCRNPKKNCRLSTNVDHIARRLLETWLADVVARLLPHHDLANIRRQLRIRSAPGHLTKQIMVALRKQTGPYLSIGRQPHPAAVSTERPRHWRNDPNLPHPIVKSESLRRLARRMRRQLHQRTVRIQSRHNLIHRDHGLALPTAVLFERHPLDKPHNDALPPRELRKLLNLSVVESTQQNAVHLHRPQPPGLRLA